MERLNLPIFNQRVRPRTSDLILARKRQGIGLAAAQQNHH